MALPLARLVRLWLGDPRPWQEVGAAEVSAPEGFSAGGLQTRPGNGGAGFPLVQHSASGLCPLTSP